MYAHQIIHPSGCQNIYLAFHRKPEGYDFIGLCRPQQMNSTLVGRMTSAERRGLAVNFDVVHAGVSHAFSQKVVRLQNPILLLEQGLQTGNPTLAMLMFVMGLDVLFMAGDKVSFVTRAAGFLGLNSYVFPQVLSFDFQPLITVGEVAADLYDLRNLIAHGQEIPKHPFRQEYDVTRITGPGVAHLPCSYVDVLMEAGLFMLTGSLAKIFKDGLYADVGNATKWRATMNRSEHRFKDSGGVLDSSRRSTR